MSHMCPRAGWGMGNGKSSSVPSFRTLDECAFFFLLVFFVFLCEAGERWGDHPRKGKNKDGHHEEVGWKSKFGEGQVRVCVLSLFSHIRLYVTLRTVARQAPLSVGFSRQEY